MFTGSIKLTSTARERIAATPSAIRPDSFNTLPDTKGKYNSFILFVFSKLTASLV